jgi:putative transposase
LFFSWRSVVYAKNVKTIFPDIRVDSGRPRENGCNESFNGRFRDELLNGEIFVAYQTLKSLSNNGENISIQKRRHSALEYRPPALEAKITLDQRPIMHYPSSCAIK